MATRQEPPSNLTFLIVVTKLFGSSLLEIAKKKKISLGFVSTPFFVGYNKPKSKRRPNHVGPWVGWRSYQNICLQDPNNKDNDTSKGIRASQPHCVCQGHFHILEPFAHWVDLYWNLLSSPTPIVLIKVNPLVSLAIICLPLFLVRESFIWSKNNIDTFPLLMTNFENKTYAYKD